MNATTADPVNDLGREAGAREALAASPTAQAAPAITPESGNPASARGAAITSENGSATQAAPAAVAGPADLHDLLMHVVCDTRHPERQIQASRMLEQIGRASPQPPAEAQEPMDQWRCESCGCEHGVAGEPYWTHGRVEHPVEAIWRCDKCDASHVVRLVEPAPQQAVPTSEQAGAAFPMTGDEDESDLGEWQSGSTKPTEDGTYLREFDEGVGTSEYHQGKWLRDGFFPSDIQDARWRGRAAPASGGAAPELHPGTADLVRRFADALTAKLAAAEKKYGYSDGWKSSDWMDECRAALIHHLDKGDPRDVAAYCAFLWHHGESTAAPATDGDARQVGLIAAADYIDGLASGYAAEHSYTEPDTGAVVFDRRDAGLEYHSTLVELADDLRGMAARAQAKEGGAT